MICLMCDEFSVKLCWLQGTDECIGVPKSGTEEQRAHLELRVPKPGTESSQTWN